GRRPTRTRERCSTRSPRSPSAMQLPPAEYEARLRRLRAALDAAGFDALAAFATPDSPGAVIYLTGYWPVCEHAWCVVTADACKLVAGPFEHARFNGGTWLSPDDVRRSSDLASTVDELLGASGRVAVAGAVALPAWVDRALRAASGRSY